MTHTTLGRTVATVLFAAAMVSFADSFAVAQSDRYGIVDGTGETTSQAAMDRVREAGIGWVSYVLFWNLANPANGIYDWSAADAEIGYMENAGLDVYVRVAHPPAWTTGVSYPNDEVPFFCYDPTQPNNVRDHPDCRDPSKRPDPVAFDAFVRAAVARYAGKVRAWGFGLEVHSPVFWVGSSQQFVQEVLVPGYQAVKAVDPGAIVVGPDEDDAASLGVLLSLEATYGTFCDVISYHVLRHSLGASSVADRLDGELWPQVQAHGAGRPVWLTELGFLAADDCLTSSVQAGWLVDQLTIIGQRPWITKTFIFSLKDSPGVPEDFGILSADDAPKAAWYTLKQFLAPSSTFSFLAEGATGAFFDLDIAIANPTCVPAPTVLTFLKPDGSTVVQTPTIPAMSRSTIRVDGVPGLGDTAVSAVVESTVGVPLIVERTMLWDPSYYSGHTGSAVTQASTAWFFGEGSQGFFDTFLLLANSTAVPANVTVTFLRELGTPVAVPVTVPPTSRLNVFAGSITELVGTSFSITVDSDQPIIAERAMYFGTARFWDAGHESAGVPEPATSWFHAEGATGPFFDTFILLGNPDDVPANVTVTYLLPTGQTVVKNYVVGPKARLTLIVESEHALLANTAVSTTVTSDIPIISERAMYWPGGFTSWYEAHNSFGLTEIGTRWGLAEGRVGGPEGFETFILLANPSGTAADVRITYLRGDGTTVQKPYQVAPTSRFNVWVNNEVPELTDESFGAVAEVVNGVEIAVERALYWNGGGQVWGGGTNATAVLLP